ncbi:MAG: DNA polymerase-3 subunit epsilon [Acidimicrobiales bacterium]
MTSTSNRVRFPQALHRKRIRDMRWRLVALPKTLTSNVCSTPMRSVTVSLPTAVSSPTTVSPTTPSLFGSQRSFDDLGTPLAEVTFCVLDFETTGGSAATCLITEVGAVKVRAGEVLGTFQTLVNPGCAIPPNITILTGITDRLVGRAPSIDSVLPSLLEFIGGSVIVGHNVRFDMAFLQAATRRWGGPLLGNQQLDTLALARRLLVDEVPNFKLGELAKRLRLPHQPSHRALDDAWATTDLLHYLIERASAWGVTGLDDLVALPTITGHPQWKKLALTKPLPRRPGVYQFRDADGRILYIGKATDLRSRVRSYFSSDRRRKVAQLLRETHDITFQVCTSTLEAELIELRQIQAEQPRFNRRGRRPIRPVYVKLTTNERFPRLSIVRSMASDGVYLGPLTSRQTAEPIVDAIQTALPLRRCSGRVARNAKLPTVAAPCTAQQLGVAMCPCSGATSEADYAAVVGLAKRALTGEPALVLGPLEQRMQALAAEERFEEAADVRNRASAFVSAVSRQRRLAMLDGIERLVVETDRGDRIELGSMTVGQPATLDEALCISSWLERNVEKVRLVSTTGQLSSPLPALPDFTPIDAVGR